LVEQDGIQFLVRIVSNLARKDEAKKKQEQKSASGRPFNPFLPYEQDLFVADISPTHLCLLNKYNVVDYHLLIITRAFEEQETWLTLADFEALWACLAQIDGLVFYNSGQIAGASQPHKHLQLVPLPLLANRISLPIEPALACATFQESVGTISPFQFLHALAQIEPEAIASPSEAAQASLECYHALMQAIGLADNRDRPGGAYNLLVTRQWMLAIPRSQASFQSVAVNALGFAGALLVRNEQQLNVLKEWGPLAILKNVVGICQDPH
jgi:ATP adenylyltransferase